jgi:death-on-curing protein
LKEVKYPSVEQVERLHNRVLDITGGERGDLSRSNLEYILEAVKEIGEELDLHDSIKKKAAFLLYNLIAQHPFVNGNKRTAFELVKLFLRLNGSEIKAKSQETYSYLADIAAGRRSLNQVEEWIATNLAKIRAE